MSALQLHEGQIDVPDALVRSLIDTQFPQWSDLELTPFDSDGTIHRIDRLGDGLVVRLPFIDWAAHDVAQDAERLPMLAAAMPVRVPTLVGRGVPAQGMPWHWGVYSWLDGTHPALGVDDDGVVGGLVATIRALRSLPATGPISGADFDAASHDATNRPYVLELASHAPWVVRIWDEAVAASPHQGAHTWIHGDLMPGNLLLNRRDELTAVLDWGASGIGDPALDLIGAWTVLGPVGRERLLGDLEATSAEIARARGFALRKVATGLNYYATSNPRFASILAHTLSQLAHDAGRE